MMETLFRGTGARETAQDLSQTGSANPKGESPVPLGPTLWLLGLTTLSANKSQPQSSRWVLLRVLVPAP